MLSLTTEELIATIRASYLPMFTVGAKVRCEGVYSHAVIIGSYDDNGYTMYIIQYSDYDGSPRKLAAGLDHLTLI